MIIERVGHTDAVGRLLLLCDEVDAAVARVASRLAFLFFQSLTAAFTASSANTVDSVTHYIITST
jgi:hypothetical protein